MLIAVENHLSCILEMMPEEEDWIFEYLSFSEPVFRKNYKTGKVEFKQNKQRTIVNRKNLTFPSGFIRMLYKQAKKEDPPIEIQISDRRIRPPAHTISPIPEYLRDYQREAVDIILKRKRGIIHHSTGAGKTVVAVALAQCVPIRWLFLVRSKDLLDQTAEKYLEFTKQTAGIIGDGRIEFSDEDQLVVATSQTLNARRSDSELWKLIQTVEGIMVDECHGLAARVLQRITLATQNAYYRVGFSGTPLARSDARSLLVIGALGPVIHRVKADELVDAGYLSKAHIEMHKIEQYSTKPTWQGAYGELIVRSASRNKLVTRLMKKAKPPCLVFVKEIKHGQILKQRAEKAGLRVEFISGNKLTPERKNAIKRLIRGDIDCIIATVVFQEGIDIPELRSLVIATSGKSAIQTLQRIGRGMRKTDSKHTFDVYDIYDTGNTWTEKHSAARKNWYKKEGHEVKIMEEQ
jgi:superfamily II DNA or RNA helicase